MANFVAGGCSPRSDRRRCGHADTLRGETTAITCRSRCLLGLVALVPVLATAPTGSARPGQPWRWPGLTLQTATVWDYSRTSERTASRILRATPAVGTGERIATLLAGIRTGFRANPCSTPIAASESARGTSSGATTSATLLLPRALPQRARPPRRPQFRRNRLMDAPDSPTPARLPLDCLLTAHRLRSTSSRLVGARPALDAVNAREVRCVYADGPMPESGGGRRPPPTNNEAVAPLPVCFEASARRPVLTGGASRPFQFTWLLQFEQVRLVFDRLELGRAGFAARRGDAKPTCRRRTVDRSGRLPTASPGAFLNGQVGGRVQFGLGVEERCSCSPQPLTVALRFRPR